ncbi:MAG: YggS family pyridoxal phosphate-dependent enzyme [Chloroflexi bacterium]|nr:YggS family pyridoxal phosphate-dependent enzyme [Chloroflexota bacterium]
MTATGVASDIRERVAAVRARIEAACARSGRDPASVTLIAVSKTHPPEAVLAAWEAGITNFGENRVQEALAKMEALAATPGAPGPANFHLIGHLQSNKARAATGRFAILHAVDSERILRAIDAAATAPQRVMLEVNVAADPAKFGMAPALVPAILAAANTLPNVRVEGLMTVAPLVSDPEDARPFFRQLRQLAAEHGLPSLSMGMTGDYEVAIEEGATHVRVGRAIFGERIG